MLRNDANASRCHARSVGVTDMIGRFLRNRPKIIALMYVAFERVFMSFAPLMKKIGLERVEKIVLWPERITKQIMFDCQMCGQCILHSTGMTCPMSCPKNLRNGPCGGVRENEHCEVIPEMKCVWTEAYYRSQKMVIYTDEMQVLQPAVNHSLKDTSSWVNMISGLDKKMPEGWSWHE